MSQPKEPGNLLTCLWDRTFKRIGPWTLKEPIRSFRVPPFVPIRMRNGMELRAAGSTVDGRGYFVQRWATMDGLPCGWVAEKRSESSRKVILDNFAKIEPRINRGISEFFGRYQGETFFIVGSGPSLIKNVALLRKQPGSKIIAINAALKAMEPGVADFYFTLDWLGGKHWLEGVKTDGVKLISSVTTPPELLDKFKDYYHFVGMTQGESTEQGVSQRYAHLGQLDSALTGTYSASHFAWRCGAKRIVYVGQDFACRWGMYHWDEPLSYQIAKDREFYVAPDIDEGITLTDRQLKRNCDIIVAAAMWCEHDGVEVINATEGGIMNWRPKPLAEVYDMLEKEHGKPGKPVPDAVLAECVGVHHH